ncbi:hypothetical protein [Candidatus Nitrosocaldus islandicus]|uniref:hypothetical protein n=1 Tax=Candidatus Nitrosocaldus islandicus TaxID=2045011 RepID=UPI000CD202BA|nr:hypothetical protein [Candidatus Nitrosocaldus islandicus]
MIKDNDRREELFKELWNVRQQLYRLYDLEKMTEWKAKDLIALYELFEEYAIADNNNNKDSMLTHLHTIKAKIDEKIREASIKGETRRKAYLSKQIDKVLTLIALAESDNKEGINRLVSMYKLLMNNKQLLEALKEYLKNKENEKLNEVINLVKQDLENKIIELKKRLL